MSYEFPGVVPSDAAGAAAQRALKAVTASIGKAGRSSPLGPAVYSSGVDFSLYSRDALRVDLRRHPRFAVMEVARFVTDFELSIDRVRPFVRASTKIVT